MALSVSDIKTIHSNKLATPNQLYYGADGFTYIGTSDKRLLRQPKGSQVDFNPTDDIESKNVSNAISEVRDYLRNRECEIDFGLARYQRDGVFSIIDEDVTPESIITVSRSAKSPSDGRSSDEVSVEGFYLSANPKQGSFDLYVRPIKGTVSGKFVITYKL